ncbi:hypothetical protein X751_26820 [Mesorhizobium sp. LNJC395A00]|nr:hypothetical protein X751_26820 [Mesorhizobium sp. LNJC395A00]
MLFGIDIPRARFDKDTKDNLKQEIQKAVEARAASGSG